MVTQQGGTEAPYNNKYDKTFEPGIYVDVVTGEPLFLSTDKFDSGCGWPAFSKPIDPNVVVYRKDTSLAAERTEVSSRTGGSHLGHVFVGEGISPTDVRFCIDSASLKFIPYADMDKAGYGAYKAMVEKEVQKSTTGKP
jgi:peptide methionine sulfoxide reductase msrA/msrB